MTKGNGTRTLVIVESPTKARTIGRYLGAGYEVTASNGHVVDLPDKDLGVDIEGGFEPVWVVQSNKSKKLKELKALAKGADRIVLATDPDREGEAIAYHVADRLGYAKNQSRFQRVVFREVTKRAVEQAMASPGELDLKMVESQQTRRILDRLVGYQASPFLNKPIRPGLSAGRVQTVALRLICDREDEIQVFEPQEYWSITALLEKDGQDFEAKLHKIGGKSFTLENEAAARGVLEAVGKLPFQATDVKRRERRKNPPAPFTTSTLQQEASKRLRFGARRTMQTAQRLYEGIEVGGRGQVGLITYMRTDSTRVSPEAVGVARRWVEGEMGERYLPSAPRLWEGKQSKGAQEAHEAIRPTDVTLHPDAVRRYLKEPEARLYELIWLRFVAGQMSPAVFDTTTVDFDLPHDGAHAAGTVHTFRATGSVLKFDGFTRLYREATEDHEHRRLDDMDPLPDIQQGDGVNRKEIVPKQHFTQPPPRFSEASLVKELESLGIGRPSTYATILETIEKREYVEQEDRRFKPTPLGDTVAKLLVRVFPNIFDVAFTSRMEGELDRVEEGEVHWRTVLEEFYPGFKERLDMGRAASEELVKELLAAEGEVCDKCGRPMLVKWNKRGRFLGCSGYPECKSTRSMDGPQEEALGNHPDTGEPVFLKAGPYGHYVQLGEDGAGKEKPPRTSVPPGVEPGTVNLPYALMLLSLPRVLGNDPESGKEITANLGRYGPYVRRGGPKEKDYRNLAPPEMLFTVTLDEALELFARPSGPAVLKEFGPHPSTGNELRILDGRYGPYLTDGEQNANLGKGTQPDDLSLEDAVALLAEKGKKPGGRGRRGASKKSSATKTKAGKNTTKRPSTKKPAAKKPAAKKGTAKKPAARKSAGQKGATGGKASG
ncbi:MAG: type I DNA topoisomerase [Gemmatimonadota bacterium]